MKVQLQLQCFDSSKMDYNTLPITLQKHGASYMRTHMLTITLYKCLFVYFHSDDTTSTFLAAISYRTTQQSKHTIAEKQRQQQ